MNDARESWFDEADEDATIRLLRVAGQRSPVPAVCEARVRAVVHAQWEAGRRRRAVRRRVLSATVFLATATALMVSIGRPALVDRSGIPPGELVAVVGRIDGTPRRVSEIPAARPAVSLSPGDFVSTGEWIETDPYARVALRFSDGTSVRLDVGSRARPVSSSAIELSAGAVYVDTGRETGRFEVRTAAATARDVGTQFEVRLLVGAVRLRVRTGIVELKDRTRSVSGRGGTEITLSATRAVSRPIAAHGSEWDWTARVSPPLEIEGMTLAGFLERLAREHGWALQYGEPTLAREASSIILHGSVKGLPPHEAVGVAIATSGLGHRLENGELVVLPGPGAR